MTLQEIILNVLAGGLLGVLGQGIRIAVGLKKLSDKNTSEALAGHSPEAFSTSRLVISIFIGFVAGAIGMLVKGTGLGVNGDYSTESIVTIIAIGYSGADFIEGIFNMYQGKLTTAPAAASGQLPQANLSPATEPPMLVDDEALLNTPPAQG